MPPNPDREIRGISAWVFLFCFLYPSVSEPKAALIPTLLLEEYPFGCSSFAVYTPWSLGQMPPNPDREIRGISAWVFLFCCLHRVLIG